MTATALASNLREAIEDDVLVITAGLVDAPTRSVLAVASRNGAFSVVGPTVRRSGETVTVQGEASAFGIDASIRLSQSGVGDNASSRLTVTLPDGWSVGASFPTLGGTFLSSMPLDGAVIETTTTGDTQPEVHVVTELPALGIGSTSIEVSATAGNLGLAADLGSVALPGVPWLSLDATVMNISAASAAGLFIGRFSASVMIDGVSLPVEIEAPSDGGLWTLRIVPQDGRLPGLASIAALANSDALAGQLPSAIADLVTSVQLDEMSIGFSPIEGTVSTVAVALQVPDVIEVIPGRVQVGPMNLLLELLGSDIVVSVRSPVRFGELEAELSGSLSADPRLTASIESLSLAELVDAFLPGETLPPGVPDLRFADLEVSVGLDNGDLSLSGRSDGVWELPIGTTGLRVEDLSLQMSRTADGAGHVLSGSVAGTIRLGAASLTVSYDFPGDLVLSGSLPTVSLSRVIQELGGADALRGTPLPPGLLNLGLSNVNFTVKPDEPSVSLSADTVLGPCEIVVKRIGGEWAFAVGVQASANGGFSAVSSDLAVLDDLGLDGSSLVLSSTVDPELQLRSLGDTVQAQKGLNLFASMTLVGTGADEILGLERIEVSAAVGPDPRKMVLEAAVEVDIDLGDGVALAEVQLRLKPDPADFSLALLGVLIVDTNDTQLRFTGGLEIEPRSAKFIGTMQGRWQEPFGFKGVALADVAIELGVSFPPPLPSIAVAGKLRIGEFTGSAALAFDSAVPSRSMVAVEFNRLFLMDVIAGLCSPEVAASIPVAIQQTVLNIGFENVKIYIVPQATSIGEFHYEAGYSLRGRMSLWGLRVTAVVEIDYGSGLYLSGEVDPIEVGGGIFRLVGVGDRLGPSLLLDLQAGGSPVIDVQGVVEVLGLSQEAVIRISDQGFYVSITGRIFDLFEANLTVRGSDLAKGGDLHVVATMRNDLLAYLREQATAAIAAAAEEATRSLSAAQRDIARHQVEVNRLSSEVNRLRGVVRAERERDAANVRAARAGVEADQRKVNGLNTDIASMRRTIEAERRRDQQGLQAAQRDVAAAQGEVNKLQADINAAHARIRQLRGDIAWWERWYSRLAWYDKAWGWARLAAETGWRGVEIGAQYTRIGSVEAARGVANGVLELAKLTVRGIEQASKTFPIDADPRLVGLYAAHGVATAALQTARWVLRGAEELIDSYPIDLDPRIVAVLAIQGTATAGLAAADLFLEGLKATVGAVADVATFIAEAGLGGILDIRYARFEGQLSAAAGGSVALTVGLEFMGDLKQLDLRFNFQNPLSAIEDLVAELLPAGPA